MNATSTRGLTVAVAALLALGLAACGSSSSTSSSPSNSTNSASGGVAVPAAENPINQSLTTGTKGGTLTVLNNQDFEHLDPGEAYFVNDYEVMSVTQRNLYSYVPNNPNTPVPDLASGPAIVSNDGLTVTVHIKTDVDFSPPVNRAVTSADVEYAIDRAANPNVANPYWPAYFANLEGFSKADGGPFPGVNTPNSSTIVFHLTKPTAAIVIGALALPISAPVPESFAKPFDAHKPTTYGSIYTVATGPYMLKADAQGKFLGIGYQPGKSATLVRNPNWNPKTDFRPAYVNQINVDIGGDPTVIGHQVLAGSGMVENDPPPNSIIELAYKNYPTQMAVTQGAGILYVALNNKQGPFANVNLRKAVWAAMDRVALQKATGGPLTGPIGTHFIYPGTSGFDQAGGLAGPQVDYNEYPDGNMAVAEKYMKLAGYSSGKYTGSHTVTIVGSSGDPNQEYAEIVNQTLLNLGFKTNLSIVDQSVMYSKYCGVPAAEIDVCPDVGWIRDFSDPQTVLDPTFNGKNIVPTNNSNFGQVNDPAINAAMDQAELVTGTANRAVAWAKIDDMLVAQAVAVPFQFEAQPLVRSADVQGVSQQWNEGTWDYAFTSLMK